MKNEHNTTESLETTQYISMLKLHQSLAEQQPGVYTAYTASEDIRYYVTDVELHYIAGEIAHIRVTYNLHYPFVLLGNTIWITSKAEAYSRYNPKFDS